LVRVPLRYYGAHTGRWSGEEAVNLGNLGGAGRGKEINKLIGQVRHTLRAPPGCVLVLVDSAQVEARNVAWYADQSDLVDEFRNKGDPYSSLASDLFQTKVWKWRKSDVEEYPGQEKRITIYRGFGKDAILGCGYGMGAVKFHTRCLANDELRPHFDSGEYTEETTARVVETYRTKYRRIPEFWSLVERAWRIATKYHGKQIVGALEFWNEDGTTHMRLPSGRVMYYHTACVNARDELFSASCRSPTNVMGKLWGGHLTENIVQATCRDALRDWILMAEENGIHIVLHVYDEMIAVAAEDKAESVMKTMIEIMRTVPSWAEGMPFDAEGKISPYYTK
jgi:DNA polymerase